ncbi:MAG TPA: hypothetical protein VKJ01_14905 [Candidatus Solibacter sp.]|jgi:uncharacterized protein (DUF697 family)|nr:hypothetical protein [Candidatus Solibacter sp.]
MHEFDIPAFPHETESFEYEYSYPKVLSESQELELAAELMEVSNEQELEQFLGDLIKKAGSAIGGLIKSPIGQALGGALKGVAKQVLPMAGQALGGAIGGPAGSQIGGQLASAAGSIFGLELEAGEQEFEAAQSFVRLAADAVKNAASAPPGANPHAVAQTAVAQASQVHAPGLFGPQGAGPMGPGGPEFGGGASRGHSGRWIRRGSKVVLFGV